jgi:O-6-methylguanine DNA methyltransferase
MKPFSIQCEVFAEDATIYKTTLIKCEKPTLIVHSNSECLKDDLNFWWDAYWKKVPPPVSFLFAMENIPPFYQKVLQKMKKIPFATTVTYGELAALAKNPKGIRAAASACANNPFPLFFPCHRVVAKKGLGGFSLGLDIKKVLLEHEFGMPIASLQIKENKQEANNGYQSITKKRKRT